MDLHASTPWREGNGGAKAACMCLALSLAALLLVRGAMTCRAALAQTLHWAVAAVQMAEAQASLPAGLA